MGYAGSDRRIHKVYVTRNTEYHVRRNHCVAVRDRRSGSWLPGHLAVRSRISGGLRFFDNGSVLPNDGNPSVGESGFFSADGRDLVTSPLVVVERPTRATVTEYP